MDGVALESPEDGAYNCRGSVVERARLYVMDPERFENDSLDFSLRQVRDLLTESYCLETEYEFEPFPFASKDDDCVMN